jgi:hypothetical protein
MLLTAPELNHLRPLTDMIEQDAGVHPPHPRDAARRQGPRHRPPTALAGPVQERHELVSRLPNKDGKGVKGQHVINIELDEAQDYPLAGWIEIVETLNAGLPGAMWRCHGVSKGVRDKFFEKTQPDSGGRVHRPMAMHRPTWGASERQAKIKEYGGSPPGHRLQAEHLRRARRRLQQRVRAGPADELRRPGRRLDLQPRRLPKVMLEFERFPTDATDADRLALIHSWIDIPGTHKHGYSQKAGGKEVGSPKGYSAYWAAWTSASPTTPPRSWCSASAWAPTSSSC